MKLSCERYYVCLFVRSFFSLTTSRPPALFAVVPEDELHLVLVHVVSSALRRARVANARLTKEHLVTFAIVFASLALIVRRSGKLS